MNLSLEKLTRVFNISFETNISFNWDRYNSPFQILVSDSNWKPSSPFRHHRRRACHERIRCSIEWEFLLF